MCHAMLVFHLLLLWTKGGFQSSELCSSTKDGLLPLWSMGVAAENRTKCQAWLGLLVLPYYYTFI